MSVIHGFQCPRCGSSLFLTKRVRPVCRVEGCGTQMKLIKAKVTRKVSMMAVQVYNDKYGKEPREKA